MGGHQSKRSVDITTTPKKGNVEGDPPIDGRVEKIEENDKPAANGSMHGAEPDLQEVMVNGSEVVVDDESLNMKAGGEGDAAKNGDASDDHTAKTDELVKETEGTEKESHPKSEKEEKKEKDKKEKDSEKKHRGRKKLSFRSLSMFRKDKNKASEDTNKTKDSPKENGEQSEGAEDKCQADAQDATVPTPIPEENSAEPNAEGSKDATEEQNPEPASGKSCTVTSETETKSPVTEDASGASTVPEQPETKPDNLKITAAAENPQGNASAPVPEAVNQPISGTPDQSMSPAPAEAIPTPVKESPAPALSSTATPTVSEPAPTPIEPPTATETASSAETVAVAAESASTTAAAAAAATADTTTTVTESVPESIPVVESTTTAESVSVVAPPPPPNEPIPSETPVVDPTPEPIPVAEPTPSDTIPSNTESVPISEFGSPSQSAPTDLPVAAPSEPVSLTPAEAAVSEKVPDSPASTVNITNKEEETLPLPSSASVPEVPYVPESSQSASAIPTETVSGDGLPVKATELQSPAELQAPPEAASTLATESAPSPPDNEPAENEKLETSEDSAATSKVEEGTGEVQVTTDSKASNESAIEE